MQHVLTKCETSPLNLFAKNSKSLQVLVFNENSFVNLCVQDRAQQMGVKFYRDSAIFITLDVDNWRKGEDEDRKVDGLCGNFNDNPYDDISDADSNPVSMEKFVEAYIKVDENYVS